MSKKPCATVPQLIRTLMVDIVTEANLKLCPYAVVTVSLDDITFADSHSHSLAKIQLDVDGAFPISLALSYDIGRFNKRNRYALNARIDFGGSLLCINTTVHPFDPQQTTDHMTISVESVRRPNQPDDNGATPGIHGGNLIDQATQGIHGGNLKE